MKTIDMYKQGEHVLFEMEIHKVKLVGDDIVYTLKAAGLEDYLDKEYKFDKLIPIEKEGKTKNEGENHRPVKGNKSSRN